MYRVSGAIIALPPRSSHSPVRFCIFVPACSSEGRSRRGHHQADGQNEAASFKGIVPTTQLMKFVYRGPDCNVNMFAGVVHGHAGQWHPVLPADQSPDTADFRLYRTQSPTVAITPYQALCVSRHQLAVMIRQLCLGRNHKQTVVEGSVSRARLNTLVYSHYNVNFQITGSLAQSSDFGTRNSNAVLPQAGEHLLCGEMLPQSSVRTYVQPSGITWQPGFSESHELCATLLRILNDLYRPSQTCCFVQINRSKLRDCRT